MAGVGAESSERSPQLGPRPVVVYKLGGSLLDLPDLPERLRRVVPADLRPLFVVGGGPTADLVREWDRIHDLGEERAHWLALRSLELNEALLAELLPHAAVATTRQQAESLWGMGLWPIIAACRFVAAEESSVEMELPHSWDATSDSIAAWIAARWPAERLVLLKSASPTEGNPQSAIRNPQSAWLDPHFPRLAASLPCVEWINLRDDAAIPQRLSFPPQPSPRETAAPPTR